MWRLQARDHGDALLAVALDLLDPGLLIPDDLPARLVVGAGLRDVAVEALDHGDALALVPIGGVEPCLLLAHRLLRGLGGAVRLRDVLVEPADHRNPLLAVALDLLDAPGQAPGLLVEIHQGLHEARGR